MIEKVFTHQGQKETVTNAMRKLEFLDPSDKYNRKKAAGALGGASRWKFIGFENGHWERIR